MAKLKIQTLTITPIRASFQIKHKNFKNDSYKSKFFPGRQDRQADSVRKVIWNIWLFHHCEHMSRLLDTIQKSDYKFSRSMKSTLPPMRLYHIHPTLPLHPLHPLQANCPPPPPAGCFDFPKFSLVFAPEVPIILFCIWKNLGEVSDLKNKSCLDTTKAILYNKNAKMSKKPRFYIIKQAILHPDSFLL